ncbi:MAG: hypothetical protein MUO77_08165, partial [Anaerolineales bacterium]|nr:hypothetical protein [Anaerolineales bacterium]
QIVFIGDQIPVEIGAGQMIGLVKGAAPLPLNEAVINALNPPLDKVPVFETIQPSLSAQLQNWLARTGIGITQIITFITYILSLVALFTIPTIVLYLRNRKRSKGSHHKENH